MSRPLLAIVLAISCVLGCSNEPGADGESDTNPRSRRDTGGNERDTGGNGRDTGVGDTNTPDADGDAADDDAAPPADAGDVASDDVANDDTRPDTAGVDTTDEDTARDTAPDTSDDSGEVCATVDASAENVRFPVDIVWIIDNSLSMEEEIRIVEARINDFARFIGDSGLDYRVVMISYDDPVVGDGWYNVCVPEPLSDAPGCPDTDSARYRHVRQIVDSRDSLQLFASTYSQYSDFLRPEAKLHIIEVSDDDSDVGADAFETSLGTLSPAVPDDYVFHSIVGFTEDIRDPWCDGAGCPCAYNEGTVYRELTRRTGGVEASICQSDWSPVFAAIQTSVVDGAILPCTYPVPELDSIDEEIDPDLVNVFFTPDGGARTVIPGVDGESDCGSDAGWYWDDPGLPRFVNLCLASCGAVAGSIDIEFGCETIKR